MTQNIYRMVVTGSAAVTLREPVKTPDGLSCEMPDGEGWKPAFVPWSQVRTLEAAHPKGASLGWDAVSVEIQARLKPGVPELEHWVKLEWWDDASLVRVVCYAPGAAARRSLSSLVYLRGRFVTVELHECVTRIIFLLHQRR